MKKAPIWFVFAVTLVVLTCVVTGPMFSRNVAHAAVVSESTDQAHDEHGHEESGNLNPLASLKKDLAFWSLVIFGGLVLIIGRFGFKPIAKALDEREKHVADNIAGAERANQEAKELLKQYQAKLSEAEGEVKAIVENGKQEASRAGEAIVAKAREAAQAERIRATKEIEAATDGALQELATKSADLAVSLAGKILKKELNPQEHAGLIQNAVSDFSKN